MTIVGAWCFLALMVAGLFAADYAVGLYLRAVERERARSEAAYDALTRWQS